MPIPRHLHRCVPEHTSPEVEAWWAHASELHPGWQLTTWRDPLDPADFPLTAPSWPRCTTGAQLAGLIRLEALWHHGGIYLDSDVEPFRPLDPLTALHGFAGWEDPGVVPDAVLGFEAAHPALTACIELALARLRSDSPDWRTGAGAWSTGPGVTTSVLPGRADVLLLPPGSLYPVHYTEKDRLDTEDHAALNPWSFVMHRWAGSWLPEEVSP